MSEGFGTTCSVGVQNTYNTTGTVTRAKIAPLSPAQIKGLFTGAATGVGGGEGWNEMKALLKHQVEMQACGIRRSPLHSWLMSSNKPGQGRLINVHRSARGPSLIAPFILGRQKSLWNADHWVVIANFTEAAYEAQATELEFLAGGIGTGNRVIRVESSFGGTMDLHPDYFLPGKRVHVMSRGGGSALRLTQFEIVRAANSSATSLDVEVSLNQPTASESAGYASSFIPPDPAVSAGVLFLGINNIADVEKWCYNMLNVNTTKLVPFWYQTRRMTRSVSQQYEEMLSHLMENNEWYSVFNDLPMAERNRQDEQRDQTEWMNAFFFGERYNNKQNLEHWGELEQIKTASGLSVDPGTGGEFMGFRANMIGVIPQLADCGRFVDNAGNASGLPLNTFLEDDIWKIVRARRSQGRPCTEVDIYTDETTADEFMQAFIAYSKVKTGDIARINIESGFSEWGFPFRRFKLYKPMGVSVNLITDDYFNDLATAAGQPTTGAGLSHGAGAAGLGKFLMVLDLGQNGTVYPSVIASNRKQYNVGEINDLAKVDATYSCVMENPTIRKTLTSTTTTAFVECPSNSLVVANFDKIVAGS